MYLPTYLSIYKSSWVHNEILLFLYACTSPFLQMEDDLSPSIIKRNQPNIQAFASSGLQSHFLTKNKGLADVRLRPEIRQFWLIEGLEGGASQEELNSYQRRRICQ